MAACKKLIAGLVLLLLCFVWIFESDFFWAETVEFPVRVQGKSNSFNIYVNFKNVAENGIVELLHSYELKKLTRDLIAALSQKDKVSMMAISNLDEAEIDLTIKQFSEIFDGIDKFNVYKIYKYGDRVRVYFDIYNVKGLKNFGTFDFVNVGGEWKYVLPMSDNSIRYVLLSSKYHDQEETGNNKRTKNIFGNFFLRNKCEHWYELFKSGYQVSLCIPLVRLDENNSSDFYGKVGLIFEGEDGFPVAYVKSGGNYLVVVKAESSNIYYLIFLLRSGGNYLKFRSQQSEIFLTPVLLGSYLNSMGVYE